MRLVALLILAIVAVCSPACSQNKPLTPKMDGPYNITKLRPKHQFSSTLDNSVYAQNFISISKRYQDQTQLAFDSFISSLKTEADTNAQYALNLAIAFHVKGDLDNAISVLDTALLHFPNNFSFNYALASIFYDKADYRQTEQQYLHIINKDQTQGEAWYQLGYLYSNTDELSNFTDYCMTRAISISPKNADAEYELARLLSTNDDIDKALIHLDNALKYGFTNIDLLESDNDFENLEQDDRYQGLIDKYK